MKIALLTRNQKLYSHQRLIETAAKRGHEMVPIDYLKCYMNITSKKPELRFQGEKLEGFDAVIPRIGASHTFYGLAVLRQFEMMGVYPLNESVAIGKLLEGTQGIGVVLSETHKSAKSVVEAFHGANVAILVQEFIKEAEGSDIRAFVVGRSLVAAMERRGAKDEFRSNLHRGGTANMIELTPLEKATALKAARSMGLNVAGVDMLRSSHGPVVIEVNSSPGLEGIEKATGVDVANKIVRFVERHAKPGRTRTRGKG